MAVQFGGDQAGSGTARRFWRGEIRHGVSSCGEFGSGEARSVMEVNNLCTKGE